MAERAGVSASTVGRIWRTFGLQPHVVESFKISDDPLFIEKVRDIVGLYLNPPDHAVVLSFDEKPQIQALERAQPILPMDMGRPERQTHNYIRHGTVDLFAALNVATGQVVAQTKKQHRSRDFVSFLREIDERVDPTLTVHVILDNLSAHKSPLVKRWVARHPRFQFHFAPRELPCGHVFQPCSASPDGSSKLNRVLIQLAIERHTQLTDDSFIERMTAGDETSRQTEIYELHGNLPSKSCWHMTHEAPPLRTLCLKKLQEACAREMMCSLGKHGEDTGRPRAQAWKSPIRGARRP